MIYNQNKYLYYPETLNAYVNREVVAPTHIRIKPINHCNHNCWYCAYRNDSLQLGDNIELKDVIPEAKMDEIITDIIDMEVKAVTFSGGGEPLLYKSLPKHIEKLAKSGVNIGALSNGSNLKGRMAEAFAKHGTWIRISLDGWDDASYSKARDIPDGAFSMLQRNMKLFIETGTDCVLGVSFIIDKSNHKHIYDVCEMFKSLGVDHIKLSGVVVGNSVDEVNSYHNKINDEVSVQIEKSIKLNDKNFTVVNHYHQLEERFNKDYDTCPYLMYLTVIGADSSVYTCQDKAYTKSGMLGSIKNRSFKEFWYSADNKERIFSFNPSSECKHHCITHSKNLALLDFLNKKDNHSAFV